MTDDARLAAIVEQARGLLLALRLAEALKAVRLGLALARRLGRRGDESQLLGIATKCHYQRGDFSGAMATALDAYQLAAEEDRRQRGMALEAMGMALLGVQAYAQAQAAFLRAAEEARAAGDEALELQTLSMHACALADDGRLEEAKPAFRRIRTRHESRGQPVELGRFSSNFGVALWREGVALDRRGEREAALEPLRLALEMFEFAAASPISEGNRAICLACTGDILGRLGRVDEARAKLDAAIEALGESDSRPVLAGALLQRGRFLVTIGSLDAAESDLRRALARTEDVESFSQRAECHEALAELYRRKGDGAAADKQDILGQQCVGLQRASIARGHDLLMAQWRRFEDSMPPVGA